MTPAELALMAEVYSERESARERAEWERMAWLAAQFINISGKSVRRTVRAKDLISFPDAPKAPVEPIDPNERKRLMLEIARIHKAKFWTKIKDSEIEKLEKTGK